MLDFTLFNHITWRLIPIVWNVFFFFFFLYILIEWLMYFCFSTSHLNMCPFLTMIVAFVLQCSTKLFNYDLNFIWSHYPLCNKKYNQFYLILFIDNQFLSWFRMYKVLDTTLTQKNWSLLTLTLKKYNKMRSTNIKKN